MEYRLRVLGSESDLPSGGEVKKLFWTFTFGAILVATLDAGSLAQPSTSPIDDRSQKEKVKIVVVDKKGGAGSGDHSPKPRQEDRRGKP